MTFRYQKRPCADCPWRRDVPTGKFAVAKFRELAATAYDASWRHFACHKSIEGQEAVCAGFLLRNSQNNLAVRLRMMSADPEGEINPDLIGDGGYPLFDSYRSMAIANGVPEDDPHLVPCRADRRSED